MSKVSDMPKSREIQPKIGGRNKSTETGQESTQTLEIRH